MIRRLRLTAVLLTLTAVSWGALKQTITVPVPPQPPVETEAAE